MEQSAELACSASGYVAEIGTTHRTQEIHTCRTRHETNFLWMQRQTKRLQIVLQRLHRCLQPLFASIYQPKIIHITPIVAKTEFVRYKPVQLMQEDIAKQLRGKVTDRQARAGMLFAKALAVRQSVPVGNPPAAAAAVKGILENNDISQPKQQGIGQSAALQHGNHHLPQPVAANTHKIALHIQLQNISGAGEIARTGAYMMLQALYTEQSPFALAARITVVDKEAVELRRHIVAIEVVHHTVTKVAGKNFPLDGVLYDEAYGWRGTIAPVAQLVVQAYEVALQVKFEAQLRGGIPFVASGGVVGTEEVGKQSVVEWQMLDKTHSLTVVAVVVVHVRFVRVEVEVPRVVLVVRRSRPIVAVVAYVVHIRTVAVAGGGKPVSSPMY